MESLATMAAVQKVYINIRAGDRYAQGRKVTKKLLLTLNDLCKSRGTRLLVALLTGDRRTRSAYLGFMKGNRIAAVDCVFPVTPERQVPGEGHPSGVTHALWAERIAEAMKGMME
jgi:hypothetical protein